MRHLKCPHIHYRCNMCIDRSNHGRFHEHVVRSVSVVPVTRFDKAFEGHIIDNRDKLQL